MKRLLATALFLGLALAADGREAGESVIVSQPYNGDFYGMGRRVELRAPINGDAVVAGQWVSITAPVAEDLAAAGEFVIVGAKVGDDVRAAGREVHIEENVAGHLLAAGATVEIARNVKVGSFAWLAGDEIAIAGEIGGALKVAGETVRIAGHVIGDAEISAQKLELLPGARLDGKLKWRGGKPKIGDGAIVRGPVTGEPIRAERGAKKAAAGITVIYIAAFAVAGFVLYLLFPRAADGAAVVVRQRRLLSAALGLVMLIITPFMIILLFTTVIGWLLALVLLAFYFAMLPVGGLLGTYALTDMVLKWTGNEALGRGLKALTFGVAIIVVGVVQLVPVVGWLLSLLLLLWGLGAISQLLQEAGRSTPATASA